MRLNIRLPIWLIALLLTAGMHVLLGWLLPRWFPPPPLPKPDPLLFVQVVSAPSFGEETTRRPVIDLPRPSQQQTPHNPKFSSQWSTHADKETVHRGKGGPPAPMPQPVSAPPAKEQSDPLPGTSEEAKGTRDLSKIDLFAPARPRSLPPASPSGGTGSDDVPGDIADGDQSHLNAMPYKYASFFNRLKNELRREWHPVQVFKPYDSSGQRHPPKNWTTVVQVSLTAEGFVHDLAVVKASGSRELDEEAIQAFRRAMPFPNPPRQLLEKDGYIHFRFGFVLEMSHRFHIDPLFDDIY